VPKREKAPQYITPAGEFVWPWLNRPDDRPIKGKPQKPAYKLNIRYPANAPAWLKLKAKLDELVEESYDKAVAENPKKRKLIVRAFPYSMETDDDGEETGNVTLKLKQNASFKDKNTGAEREVSVSLYDAQLSPIDRKKVSIYGGSVGTASFSTRPYLVDSTNGAGISLDLKAVQVLKLVTQGERSGESYGFAKNDEYEGIEQGEDEAEETSEAAGGDEADATDF
jgi:hypothetical protein